MNTQVLQTTIHTYCQQMMTMGDFNKHQQLLEQLKLFILDWNNLPIFRAIIEKDGNSQTTFVLYELLQKALANGAQFINVTINRGSASRSNLEDYENQEKQICTEIAHTHLDIAINYLSTQSLSHPNYVVNTLLFAVAFMLRKYWCEIINIDDLVEKLLNQFLASQNPLQQAVGCKFFENVLNCIRQYYYATGYLEFRKVMIGFQRASLSKILQCTHKSIQMNLQGKSFLQLYLSDKLLGESLIKLLNQIITFNFNLSFYELDMDQDNNKDNTIVNFPEYYYSVLSDQGLLRELFRGCIDFYEADYNLSLNFIQMLQRIACVRLSLFMGKKCKKVFRNALWEGLNYLLQNQQIFLKNYNFCNELNSFSIRLINNLTMRKLHKFKDVFDNVIKGYMQLYSNLLRNNGFKISPTNVCIKMQEVWNQLLYQLQLNKPNTEQEILIIQNCQQGNFKMLIQQILQNNLFSELNESISVKKLKKYLDQNFNPFHQVYQFRSIEYLSLLGEMLTSLPMQSYQQLPPPDQCILLQKFSTLLCFISTLVLYSSTSELNMGFEYFQFSQREERPQNEVQNKLLHLILEIIGFTNKIIIGCSNQFEKIYHMSILIFIESFISLSIEGLNYDENTQIIKATSNLYQSLLRDNLVNPNYIFILQLFLEKCFQLFTLSDPQLVEQSLKIIETIYSKVKRQISRRYFRECSISVMLRQFFKQLEITCFNDVSYIRKRRLVFKIISIVWVDDSMDDYIPAIVEIYRQIKSQISTELNKINMLKYIWDLIGVTDEIDVDSIYRTFLRIIYPDISHLLSNENVILFAKDYDSSLGLLTLLSSIFYNKNTRLQNENIQLILYQIYGKAMNYFIILCDYLSTINSDGDQNVLKQSARLFKVMGQISASKQINQGFFIIHGDQTFLSLFTKQLLLIQIYRPKFKDYPKYKKTLFECLDNLCTEHSETFAYRCSVEHYVQLFTISRDTLQDMMKLTTPKGEEQIYEESQLIGLMANLLCNVNAFLIQEASVGHPGDTQMITSKILEIQTKGQEVYTQIFEYAFQLLINYSKNQKIIAIVPDIMFAVSLYNPNKFQALLVLLIQQQQANLSLSNQVLDIISLAYKNIEEQIHPQAKDTFNKKIKSLLEFIQN